MSLFNFSSLFLPCAYQPWRPWLRRSLDRGIHDLPRLRDGRIRPGSLQIGPSSTASPPAVPDPTRVNSPTRSLRRTTRQHSSARPTWPGAGPVQPSSAPRPTSFSSLGLARQATVAQAAPLQAGISTDRDRPMRPWVSSRSYSLSCAF